MKNMKGKRTLDFDALPELDGMDIFIRLDTDLDAKLKEDGIFQEVYERSQSAQNQWGQTFAVTAI